MNINKNSSQYKAIKADFRKIIKPLIIHSCGGYSGKAFKQKDTIQYLIEYEVKNLTEQEKFQLYVCAIEKIILLIKGKFPFIDLTGINMSWTTEQIIDVVVQAYLSLPCLTFKDLGIDVENE